MHRRALSLRSTRLALLVSTVAAVAMSFSPLFGLHGVESALILGVLLPPFVAAAAYRLVDTARRDRAASSASALAVGALLIAIVVMLIPIVILAINALRFRQCTPYLGLGFMLLGPLFGCALAGLAGVLIGAYVRSSRLGTTLAVIVPIGAFALAVYRFWDSPGIFAFGHFGGYFPGTIYDEGVNIPTTYLTFRVTSLALGVSLYALLRAGLRVSSTRAALSIALRRAPWLGLGMLSLGSVLLADYYGTELGHRSSASFIAEELGASYRGSRCTVHVPRELPRVDARRLLADCDFRIAQLRGRLGLRRSPHITAFFFRDADEKNRLMGAARTFIAKPWRREVYLQLEEWPHPVLAHELAHIVAGEVADGPFRIAAQWGGYLPDPGLIEGTAVALARDVREDMTAHEFSRAMRDLNELPALRDVMGLRFTAQSPRKAYMAAGSFTEFLLETRSASLLRDVYRTGDLEGATGDSMSELEAEWHEYLDRIEITDLHRERVSIFLQRQSIFVATCPHQLARLRKELEEDLAAADEIRIAETCSELLDIDPNDATARAGRVGSLARAGEDEAAQGELLALETSDAPEPLVATAYENYADALWQRGAYDRAKEIYDDLRSRVMTESVARRVEVKGLAFESDERVRRLLFELFVGASGLQPAPPPIAVHLAREIDRLRSDGLGAYLEGRQLFHASDYAAARERFHEANQRGLPTPRLAQESQRLEAIACVGSSRPGWARAYFAGVLITPTSTAAQRIEAADWIARIELQ